MNLRIVRFYICAFVMLLPTMAQADKLDKEDHLELFNQILDIVKEEHFDPKSEDEMFKAAINGMLSKLDPHSAWLDPKTYENMQISTHGKFGGLGIEVSMEKGLIKIITPIEDTPAEKAGVLANDLITHLDDKPVLGLTLPEAVNIMRGKPSSRIKLTIKRPGRDKPLNIKITRAIIEIKPVKSDYFDGIGYLRLSTFNELATKNLIQSIYKMQDEHNPRAYILDLRNNPGGLLDQAVSVVDLFLDEGRVVSIRARADSTQNNKNYYARLGDIINGQPLIILLNGSSASASEIVAGALQDQRRAIILGTLSFGKGSVQTVRSLGQNKGALRLTTALYYTPSGRAIQARGLTPDIIVEQKISDKDKKKWGITSESALPNHLGESQKRKTPSISYVPKDRKKDTQLNHAINLLKDVIDALAQKQAKQKSQIF